MPQVSVSKNLWHQQLIADNRDGQKVLILNVLDLNFLLHFFAYLYEPVVKVT